MYPPGYYHNDVVAAHALGHTTNGYEWLCAVLYGYSVAKYLSITVHQSEAKN